MKSNLQKIIFYPIIFTILPLLSVFLINIRFVNLTEFLVAVFISLIFLFLIWWILFRITRSLQKSALISTVFFMLFFSFGQVLTGLSGILFKAGIDVRDQLFNNVSWKLNVILIVWIVSFLLLSFIIIKIQSDFKLITTFMNVTSIILFFIIIAQVALYSEYILSIFQNEKIVVFDNDQALQTDSPDSDYPDIYFIILDGYGREDILENYFNFNNQELLNYLSNKGFYIATASRSNYLQTFLSVSSTLNMDYLDGIAAEMGTMTNNPIPILQRIQINRLMDFLAGQGYTTIAFQSGYHATEMEQVDSYYSGTLYLTEFENELINLTPLQIWLDNFQYKIHRKRIRYTFDQLPDIVQSDQPTLIFAHILAPHGPFVFGPNGENHNPDKIFTLRDENFADSEKGRTEFNKGYTNQVIFINSLVREAVEEILSKPGRKPIIVIQGDHGPRPIWYWENMENSDLQTIFPILNAYYFPDQDYSNLYPGISPVNTFRLILDQNFNTQLGLLEDRSYFSYASRPYNYMDVTEQIENP